MQNQFSLYWIPSFGIRYMMGTDGMSFPLIALTALVSLLAMATSWPITKHEKAYCILFLLLETGMLGVFLCARLLPVLRVLGSDAAADVLPDRRLGRPAQGICGDQVLPVHAARQRVHADRDSDALLRQRLAQADRRATHCHRRRELRPPTLRRSRTDAQAIRSATTPQHTFNILALQQIGQHTESPFNDQATRRQIARSGGRSCCCSSALRSRCPACRCTRGCPMRTSKRPTPISMILAGVLLKMGGYGIIRICYPICPDAGYDLAYARLRRGRREHGLRRVRRAGPDRFQATGRLQLGQPHGLRRARHRRLERGRPATATIPTTGRWA